MPKAVNELARSERSAAPPAATALTRVSPSFSRSLEYTSLSATECFQPGTPPPGLARSYSWPRSSAHDPIFFLSPSASATPKLTLS